MDLKGKKIILASGSPRRKELLGNLGLEFTVDTENSFEETFDPATPHPEVPILMSKGKSGGFHRPLEDNEILITADTMVLCDSKILGKPHSREEAFNMLKGLSGKDHQVITGVTIRSTEKTVSFDDTTTVTFRNLTDSEIEYYIDNYKPFDKAGSYAIQEWIGLMGISAINGSVYNVIGLPVHRVYEELQNFI
ncbi:MAG: Maf family nucleotide pyrophosphatase [Bacteroidales bacterium]|nr:Maf family nucleotide pyrophosphatase [Bacteroidales bacterium]